MISYLRKIVSKHRALPVSLTYFVTNRCNLNCKHCFYWKNLNKNGVELTLAEIDKFSKSIGELIILNLSGGEPFLRSDFADVAITLAKNSRARKLIITSNGSLTEKIIKDADRILNALRKTHVTFHFSIDDLDERHDASRGMPGLFLKVINTVEEMKKLKEQYNNFNVGILLAVTPINQERVASIYKFIRDNIKPDAVSPLLMRLSSKELNAKDVNIQYFQELIMQVRKDVEANILKGHNSFYGDRIARNIHHLKHRYIIDVIKKEHFVAPCFAGILSGVIYEDGNVAPCEITGYSFGNIRDFGYNFAQLWRSHKAEDIKKAIRKKKCFCTYDCALDINIAFNLKSLIIAAFKQRYIPRNFK